MNNLTIILTFVMLLCGCVSNSPQGIQAEQLKNKQDLQQSPQNLQTKFNDKTTEGKSVRQLDFSDASIRHETNKYWQLNKRVWLNIPTLIAQLGTSGCVSIEFVIDAQGMPQLPIIVHRTQLSCWFI